MTLGWVMSRACALKRERTRVVPPKLGSVVSNYLREQTQRRGVAKLVRRKVAAAGHEGLGDAAASLFLVVGGGEGDGVAHGEKGEGERYQVRGTK